MRRDIFISYSRRNYEIVDEIRKYIDDATGANCWMDLKGGVSFDSQDFGDSIIDGINYCDIFLYMLSTESQESAIARKEIDFALLKNKKVVMINIDGCSLNDKFAFDYGRFNRYLWSNIEQRDALIENIKEWMKQNNSLSAENELNAELKRIQEKIRLLDNNVGYLELFRDTNGKYGYKNNCGEIVLSCQWDDAYAFTDGLARVKAAIGKWGFIDKSGKEIIKCQWDDAKPFREYFAAVKDDKNNWGYTNLKGEVVIRCRWYNAWNFKGGVARVKTSNGKCWNIDKSGYILGPAKYFQLSEN